MTDDDEDETMQDADHSHRTIGGQQLVLGAIYSIENVRAARDETLEIGGRHLTRQTLTRTLQTHC